jgi:integrase
MARKVKDKELDTREARARLKPRGKPYYRIVERGLHLGYRKLTGKAGTWWARHYLGSQEYAVERIGAADDLSDADGLAILDFWQAQTKARERMVVRARSAAGTLCPLTVREAVESYLQFLETNRRSALDARYRVKAFIFPQIGSLECEALKPDTLRKWLFGLASEPPRKRTKTGAQQQHKALGEEDEDYIRRRRSSANRVLTILKAALNRAWREGKIASDSGWRRVEPFENVDGSRARYLSTAEAKRLVHGSALEFRPLMQAALQTGARYGELTRLRIHDFDANVGTLAIRQSKTGKSRHIVLTDEGTSFFIGVCANRPADQLIFTKLSGAAWGMSHQGRPMQQACIRAEIRPPISFHGLRHTWASLAVMNGVPLLVVAKNLGHSDTRMVERHYGHLAPSYVTDSIRASAPRFGAV